MASSAVTPMAALSSTTAPTITMSPALGPVPLAGGPSGPGPVVVATVGPPPGGATVGIGPIGVPVGVGVNLGGGGGPPPPVGALPIAAVGLPAPQQQPTPAIHVIGVLGASPACDAALCDNNGPAPVPSAMQVVDVQPLAPLGATSVTTVGPDCAGSTGGAPGGGPRPAVQLTAGQLATSGGQMVVGAAGVSGSPTPDGGATSGKELLGVGAPAVNVICASPNMVSII